jgi:hypothetical protein
VLCQDTTPAAAISPSAFHACVRFEWVANVDDRVKATANTVTHEAEQKIGIFACAKHRVGPRS